VGAGEKACNGGKEFASLNKRKGGKGSLGGKVAQKRGGMPGNQETET